MAHSFTCVFSTDSSDDSLFDGEVIDTSDQSDQAAGCKNSYSSVFTPRAGAKFNHSITLIFSGFFDQNMEHPRDPTRWTHQHVSNNNLTVIRY